jgi:hypothetical protein
VGEKISVGPFQKDWWLVFRDWEKFSGASYLWEKITGKLM